MKTLISLGVLLTVGLAFIVGSSVEKDSALLEAIEPTAEAADGCSPATKGKYVVRHAGSFGSIPSDYQSGAACKLSVCVNKGYIAYKIATGSTDPACMFHGTCFPSWMIAYTVDDVSAPAGTPACDAYWNSASRFNPPAE